MIRPTQPRRRERTARRAATPVRRRLRCGVCTALLLLLGSLLVGQPPADASDAARLRQLMEKVSRGEKLTDEELALLLHEVPGDSIDVRLVMLPVVVLDRRGRPVPGLKAEDFEVYDEGRRQPLAWFSEEEDRPFRILFLLDVSESMAHTAPGDRLYRTLLPLARQLRPWDHVRLLSFAAKGIHDETGWTNRPFSLLRRALEIEPHGRTALRDALAAAARLLRPDRRERQAIVLVSDGMDNASHRSVEQVVATARDVGVPVYVLAVGGIGLEFQDDVEERSPVEALRRVAEETGGRLFLVTDGEKADRAATTLAQELRHQYWLAFRPSSGKDGGFHRVTVRVDRRKLEARTRSGYR